MSTTSAPYRHADGSNCWTRNCSRNHAAITATDSGSVAKSSHAAKSPTSHPDKSLDSFTLTGEQVNQKFTLVTSLPGGFQAEKVNPAQNYDKDSFAWSKPMGGLWLATVDEEGVDSWSDFNQMDHEKSLKLRTNIRFTPEAKVLVIDSLADYRKILDRYPHYAKRPSLEPEYLAMITGSSLSKTYSHMSSINADGSSKRNIDYEALGKDYDAVILTEKGLYAAGKGSAYLDLCAKEPDVAKDISFYSWDLESVFVMNGTSVEVY